MKITTAFAALCLMVVMVTAKRVPSKRFHVHVHHSLHHVAHKIEHAVHHVGHEIEHGVNHLGHELGHITGIHNVKDLACKLYPLVKSAGEKQCSGQCVAAVAGSSAGAAAPLCPAACRMIFHQANKLVDC